ncbi:hypothetical protein 13VV501A_gene0041 [Vibrio phage 13VV501A]|nr:hypothetical protein 13VV501A_gene0041 [Vibrio phage 13VV501A]
MLKLNKQIKTHIADMAIRKKFKPEFTLLMQALKDAAYKGLYDKYYNEDFDLLPERSRALVQNSALVSIDTLKMERTEYRGRETGYGLNVAFDTYRELGDITLDKRILGVRHRIYNATDLFKEEYKALVALLKEASEARDTLLAAMAHYKNADKMFKELPWTEEFYPEQDKKPKCNVVPVSTIAAANEIMGL